jgi:hypothetical protein
MSYEEEDTCELALGLLLRRYVAEVGGGYMSYEEEDTCELALGLFP